MKLYFASILVLVGCSNDPLEPGSGDDPGTGTNTLEVRGSATAEARFANASHPSEFDTEFNVRVFLNGVQITTGSVILTSQFAKTPLAWTDADGGRWSGRIAGYDEVYQLDVASGADQVIGVIVDGPDIHTISAPLAGATLDSTVANPFTWSRDEVADIATFDADEIDRITIADTGDWSMGVGTLKADKDQARPNTLTLRRANQIVPAGAVGESTFTVSIENRIDVLVAPNPLLP